MTAAPKTEEKPAHTPGEREDKRQPNPERPDKTNDEIDEMADFFKLHEETEKRIQKLYLRPPKLIPATGIPDSLSISAGRRGTFLTPGTEAGMARRAYELGAQAMAGQWEAALKADGATTSTHVADLREAITRTSFWAQVQGVQIEWAEGETA